MCIAAAPPSTPYSPAGGPPLGDSQGPGSSGGANDSSLPLIVGVAAGGIVLLVVLAGLIWKFLSMGRADKMGGAVTSKSMRSKLCRFLPKKSPPCFYSITLLEEIDV